MGETSAVDRAVPTTARLLWRCSGCCFRRFQRASQRCSGRCSTTYRSSRRRQLRDGLRRAEPGGGSSRRSARWHWHMCHLPAANALICDAAGHLPLVAARHQRAGRVHRGGARDDLALPPRDDRAPPPAGAVPPAPAAAAAAAALCRQCALCCVWLQMFLLLTLSLLVPVADRDQGAG